MGLTKFFLALYLTGLILTHVIVSVTGDDRQDFLDGHNTARAEVGHGVEPLVWNYTLAAYAQAYANKRIPDCKMEESDPDGPYGECLAAGYGEFSAVDAVNGWVSEKPYYDHESNKCVHSECGHYTQVVWRDTKYLGCARSKCDNGWVFVTCNYYPSGNYYGERPY
ncbi:basic form of pathogenesis-related protein 1-like [Alnus glutinosa]|jgi:pathogenesis-related protein 1|uniref:basic form of pathogenesis-related protein 1-like n=1 Tax=Alnus glutinosa TaxID=3517 RepID=UPI002D776257|nr:basic form of pathogenesis-related protein 1-like [Alnus glutinosa]